MTRLTEFILLTTLIVATRVGEWVTGGGRGEHAWKAS
jgi:hypothetical protein